MALFRRGNFVAAPDRHFSGSARRFFVGRLAARGGETVTLFFFFLVVFSVACSVTGQIFFKHAMSDQSMSTRTRRRLDLAGGVLAMTVGFFAWLALLRRFDLSLSVSL